ncbi:PDCD10 [Mytilus edulis]|uniref:PDCD10 n=1 Tax=Mytilus edulis TaxID=6550 RepID=A0A8S3TFC2_MYTED|nr:PDCD10 [Mytilus edulis]
MSKSEERKPLLADASDEQESYTDKDKKKDKEKKKPDGPPPATLRQLFRYATCVDTICILFGSLFSLAHGAGWPVLSIVMGQMTDTFVAGPNGSLIPPDPNATHNPNVTVESFEDKMTTYALYYLIIGGVVLLSGYLQVLVVASKTTPSGAAMHPSSKELRLLRPEPSFQELNRCATNLKTILSRIPIQIDDRKQFLETIKEIAGSIKHLLDAFTKVIAEIPGSESGSKQILEDRKKEFVRYSKKFSNMLKAFFRDGSQRQNVFLSANFLIYQTNVILRTVKQETERE